MALDKRYESALKEVTKGLEKDLEKWQKLEAGEYVDSSDDEEEALEAERLWEAVEQQLEESAAEDAQIPDIDEDEEDYVRPEFREEDYVSAAPPPIVDIKTIDRISAGELATQLRDGYGGLSNQSPLVVDVRDEEYAGGHIQGALHYPSSTFEARMDELCKVVHEKGVPCVVFYCLRSQLKAPICCDKFDRRICELFSVERSTRKCILNGGFIEFLADSGPLSSLVEGLDQMYWELDIVDDCGKPVYYGC